MMRVITKGVAVAYGVGGRRSRRRTPAGVARVERLFADMAKDPALAALFEETDRRDPKMNPLGRRKRRCLMKRRRRARDRDVAAWCGALQRHKGNDIRARVRVETDHALDFFAPAWWSTPDGRRGWVDGDRAAKRARRQAMQLGRRTHARLSMMAAETFEHEMKKLATVAREGAAEIEDLASVLRQTQGMPR